MNWTIISFGVVVFLLALALFFALDAVVPKIPQNDHEWWGDYR